MYWVVHGKSIPDAQEISRDLRDFPRAKCEGNLEGRGSDFLLITNPSTGMDQEIHPCG